MHVLARCEADDVVAKLFQEVGYLGKDVWRRVAMQERNDDGKAITLSLALGIPLLPCLKGLTLINNRSERRHLILKRQHGRLEVERCIVLQFVILLVV